MIKKTLLAVSLLLAGFASQAQSVEDGTNIIGLGVRLGIYNIEITYKPAAPTLRLQIKDRQAVLFILFPTTGE